jgi:hypothetical protein
MRERQQIQHDESQSLASQTQAMLNLNRKLQNSSVKGQVKAIDLELRKLESTQAMLQCSIMKVSILSDRRLPNHTKRAKYGTDDLVSFVAIPPSGLLRRRP